MIKLAKNKVYIKYHKIQLFINDFIYNEINGYSNNFIDSIKSYQKLSNDEIFKDFTQR